MSDLIARQSFTETVNYHSLPRADLVSLFGQAVEAHANFFGLWRRAVTDTFGAERYDALATTVYPTLHQHGSDLAAIFFEELDFLWQVMPHVQSMLTFARYDPSLLPEHLSRDMELDALDAGSLVLLWNIATLTYVMQTARWTDLVTREYDQNTALKLERDVWLDYGGAEDDLLFGLRAAGAEKGDVETLLRGFQFAPGEVGLVDAAFELRNPNHGFITHHRCPSKERYGEENPERLESNCVLCVIAMRKSGEMVNQAMRCRPVNIPPYRDDLGYACRWEYWLP